ncbi:unnamed protein product, partial [Scytosiphon promiscuus]
LETRRKPAQHTRTNTCHLCCALYQTCGEPAFGVGRMGRRRSHRRAGALGMTRVLGALAASGVNNRSLLLLPIPTTAAAAATTMTAFATAESCRVVGSCRRAHRGPRSRSSLRPRASVAAGGRRHARRSGSAPATRHSMLLLVDGAARPTRKRTYLARNMSATGPCSSSIRPGSSSSSSTASFSGSSSSSSSSWHGSGWDPTAGRRKRASCSAIPSASVEDPELSANDDDGSAGIGAAAEAPATATLAPERTTRRQVQERQGQQRQQQQPDINGVNGQEQDRSRRGRRPRRSRGGTAVAAAGLANGGVEQQQEPVEDGEEWAADGGGGGGGGGGTFTGSSLWADSDQEWRGAPRAGSDALFELNMQLAAYAKDAQWEMAIALLRQARALARESGGGGGGSSSKEEGGDGKRTVPVTRTA